MDTRRVNSWIDSSSEQRALLFRAVARARRKLNLTWEDVFEQAFGMRHPYGLDYQRNTRRGAFSAERALKLADWLDEHDLTSAFLLRMQTRILGDPQYGYLEDSYVNRFALHQRIFPIMLSGDVYVCFTEPFKELQEIREFDQFITLEADGNKEVGFGIRITDAVFNELSKFFQHDIE